VFGGSLFADQIFNSDHMSGKQELGAEGTPWEGGLRLANAVKGGSDLSGIP
jgi:hypothetical protein